MQDESGRIFTGCNVENATYGLSVCAERVAILKAVSEGASEFTRVAVVADTETLTPPCGACRQILWEFCGDVELVMANLHGKSETYAVSDLVSTGIRRVVSLDSQRRAVNFPETAPSGSAWQTSPPFRSAGGQRDFGDLIEASDLESDRQQLAELSQQRSTDREDTKVCQHKTAIKPGMVACASSSSRGAFGIVNCGSRL